MTLSFKLEPRTENKKKKMQQPEENVYVNRWFGSLDEVGLEKRKMAIQRPAQPTNLRYTPDPRMRPLNIDKFLVNLNLRQKWRKMAKARVFPLAVPRHAIHMIRVLIEICETSLAKIAGLARQQAEAQQPTNLEDWNKLYLELRLSSERLNIVDWLSVDKILKIIEPLCYDETKLDTASQEGGAEEDASVAEAYRLVRTCLWILYLRLVAVKAFLEWFIPIGRLTARDALGVAQLACFPDLMVVSAEVPVLAYCQSDLVMATRALSMRWYSNLFYFSGLEKYVGILKARFVMLISFPASAKTLDRVGLYDLNTEDDDEEATTTKHIPNMTFLHKMMGIFVPMEQDIIMHQRLVAKAEVCVQSPIWTKVKQRTLVWTILTAWMQQYTSEARGQFIAKRFRKCVMAALVRVGEPEIFIQKYPNFNCNPRNIVSKLRPNDSRKYDSQFLLPALADVIHNTLAAFRTHKNESENKFASSRNADIEDRETPPDHVSARRDLLIHCLNQLFQETNQNLRFEVFLIRDLGSSPQNISEVLLKSETEGLVIILQTLSGFSVWNPLNKRLTVAGNFPSAWVEWAAETIRNERFESNRHRHHHHHRRTSVDESTTTDSGIKSKDLLLILRNIGLQKLVLKLVGP